VRIVRARHALEGQTLALMGWMRRGGTLELILVLPDGSRSLIPAAWTNLERRAEPARAGTLGRLDDLLRARRVLEPLLGRAVLAGGDDPQPEETESAAGPRSGGEPGAGGGAVGAAGRAAATGGDGAAERVDGSGRGTLGGGAR